ncbi:MAG: dihydrodipicolinate synthase family protein [Rhodospirillales bacterium]
MKAQTMAQKIYSQSPFRGQIHCPAPVTPFSAGGDLMLDAYAEILHYYLEVVEVDAMMIAGDNGEGYALNDNELRQVTETAVATVGARVPIYVHITRTSNRRCIERAEIAAAAGAPGISLGQPYIHDASAEKIVERFAEVAKAVPLRMMVYNLPLICHFNITPPVLRAICDVAEVDLVKDAPMDMGHITTMLAEMGDRFPILYGQRLTLVPALLLDAGGFVGTGPELYGRHCRDFFKVHEMSPSERLDLHARYNVLNDALINTLGTPPAGIKAALKILGLPAGVPRDHVVPLTTAEEERLRDVMIQAGVLEGSIAKPA